MNINFVNIAIDIVHQINDSPTESVDENDFKIEQNWDFPLDEVLIFLIDNDYIETENEDDVYFLTPETYDLIEGHILEDSIWSKLDHEEIESHEENLEASINEELFLKEEYKRKSKTQKILNYTLFIIILVIMSWFSYRYAPGKRSKVPNIKIDEKLIDKIERQLKHKMDSVEALPSVLYDEDK